MSEREGAENWRTDASTSVLGNMLVSRAVTSFSRESTKIKFRLAEVFYPFFW